jgi:N-hydroxyarylamine O-acetyltransferase
VLDVDALLARIGLDHRPPADLAGLREVHRAYLLRVPYEDLTIQLGEQRALDVEDVAARMLEGGRGGYCFEVNGVLGALLEALGFTVERRRAAVGPRGERDEVNHLALTVVLDGDRWLCDSGWGEGFVEPLPLRPGRHEQPPLHWTIETDGEDGWWIEQHEWGGSPGFWIWPGVVGLDAFHEPHERLSLGAESSFRNTLVVEQPRGDRVVTLRSRTYTERGPGHDVRRVLRDAGELETTLRDAFGIEVGAARAARLWDNARMQHAHHLYRRWLDELWAGDTSRIGEIVADGFVGHWPDREVRGREELAAVIEETHRMIEGLTFSLEAGPIAEGDMVAARWTGGGFAGNDLLRLEDGLVAEYWVGTTESPQQAGH